jgi:hypothetical protein
VSGQYRLSSKTPVSLVIGFEAEAFGEHGPFDLVFDPIGGEVLDRYSAVACHGGPAGNAKCFSANLTRC